jgi:hypothetical protein
MVSARMGCKRWATSQWHALCIPSGSVEQEDVPMPEGWSDKRERQYEHIKDSYEERGVSDDEAEERAARTVNKERAEKGETKDDRD